MDWTHAGLTMDAGPAMLAAFAASLVEGVEALTVVLAVGAVRGWRSALGGSFAALAVLLVLTAVLGPALTRVPLRIVQLLVGTLLLLFGLRWLRKAILRSAGILPMRDEAAAYAAQTQGLRRRAAVAGAWDREALAAAFNITMLEGIEVVFIVIAVGSAGRATLLPACLGALAAVAVVVALGAALHRPIASLPENALKTGVGILLAAFGTFWTGEGAGLVWPGGDWSILGLVAFFAATTAGAVAVARAA